MSTVKIPPSWLSRRINIVLIGCGGTGSEMLDELFRIHSLLVALDGEGLHVTAFDPDSVSQANIGRQRFWPCDTGFPKAEVLISRVNSFGGADWDYVNEAYDVEQHSNIEFDLLITCVDTPAIRADIGKYFQKSSSLNTEEVDDIDFDDFGSSSSRFWLDCGNDESSGNVILGHLEWNGRDQKLPNVFDLYPVLASMQNSDQPSCSTAAALAKQDYGVNRSVAREGANILWQFLRHGTLSHHGSYIDIKSGTVIPLRIDTSVWETFKQTA